jgi:hypothetical protein
MGTNMNNLSWTKYESMVLNCFKTHYPNSDIKRNVQIKGRYSKRKRQIDILITEITPAGSIRIVIDAKNHSRKLDVRAVDNFEGFLNDIGISKGLLIAQNGYTSTALRRAYNCPSDIELDILNFSELKKWQAFCAIPYSGKTAFIVQAPFGWIVDASRDYNLLCMMYRRGLDSKSAIRDGEFLYIDFWDKKKDHLTANQLDKRQIEVMKESSLTVKATHLTTVKRKDAKTLLSYRVVKDYKFLEIVGFIEFDNVIFFAVLFTTIEKQKSNIRRLEHLLQSAISGNVI